ncbi:MAG TPA: methyltransferase domain-containing protein [Burkholderiaceae bacterium]|nr:methyltransferase domain-containing protein [Burkholderiaceae bacterium]
MFRDLIDDFDNYSSQSGMFLDVPFVPTDDAVIKAMLRMANIDSEDILYDLGAGDGRIVVAAAKEYDCRAVGVEIDPLRIADAMEYAGDTGVEYLVDFIEGDIFAAEFSDATVVTLYLLDSINLQLRPRLLTELRPGSRIISHAFSMGDWKADEVLEVGGIKIYKWVVPAQVAGAWEWEAVDGTPVRAEISQKFQKVAVRAWLDGRSAKVKHAKLEGGVMELDLERRTGLIGFNLHFKDNQLSSVEEVQE